MNEEHAVNVIRGSVDLRTALRNAGSVAAGAAVVAERSVLYPYRAFEVRCTVATLAGSRSVLLRCLVDGINDVGATADAYVTDGLAANGEMWLDAEVAPLDAERTAWRTITLRLGKTFRMIAPFGVQLEPAGLVYKRFWILRAGEARIMTDSVTGHMHPLHAAAA